LRQWLRGQQAAYQQQEHAGSSAPAAVAAVTEMAEEGTQESKEEQSQQEQKDGEQKDGEQKEGADVASSRRRRVRQKRNLAEEFRPLSFGQLCEQMIERSSLMLKVSSTYLF
jgi:hypothetical protein